MKTLIVVPLVLAGTAADAPSGEELRRRLDGKKAKYDLKAGATCAEGYEPLTSSWKDCARAAMALGFEGDDVKSVKYNKAWGTRRPQGCFRKGNGEFHFNDGAGGGSRRNDQILCVLEGQGPSARDAGSSANEGDTSLEEYGPEGEDPHAGDEPNDHDEELEFQESVGHELADFDDSELPPLNSTEYARFWSETGWTTEPPVARSVCGSDQRKRVSGSSTRSVPWKWITALDVQWANSLWGGCSGFFISKRVIVTAGHCVYSHEDGGWARRIRVCPGRDGGSNPFGCQWVTRMFSVQGWTRSQKRGYDRAILVLPDNTFWNRGVGHFGFTTSLSGVWSVNIAGYPSDKPDGQMWRVYDRYFEFGGMLYYYADTAKGMSGGPVWSKKGDQRRIVGIHVVGGCPNGAVQVTSDVFDWFMRYKRTYG